MRPNLFPGLLPKQTGLARPAGIPSRVSTPAPQMKNSAGGNFAAMENALLKGPKPNHKKLSPGKGGKQFVKAGGENFGQG